MDELRKRATVADKPNDYPLKTWYKHAQTTYLHHVEAEKHGKYSDSYVFLLRFVSVVLEVIRQHKDFLKTDPEYLSLRATATAAMPLLESLQAKLKAHFAKSPKNGPSSSPSTPAPSAAAPPAPPAAAATPTHPPPSSLPAAAAAAADLGLVAPAQPPDANMAAVPSTAQPTASTLPLFVPSHTSLVAGIITPAELSEALTAAVPLLLIDTRPHKQFLPLHIVGHCVNIDLDVLDLV